MIVDVIILTNSTTSLRITKRTIYSLLESEKDYEFRIHLLESGMSATNDYINMGVANYMKPNETFNYNKFLNYASDYIQGEWVVISNNDVGYEKGWFTEMMKIHNQRPDIESFSPKDPLYYMKYFDWHFINSDSQYFESYIVSEAVMGWCIVIKKTALDKILPFDEQFDMYYQDNDYAEMLKLHGIKHALVRHSIACHLNTLNVEEISENKQNKMLTDEHKFRNKWKLYK
jgi:GT2 family glycosyltransferase